MTVEMDDACQRVIKETGAPWEKRKYSVLDLVSWSIYRAFREYEGAPCMERPWVPQWIERNPNQVKD